MLLASSPGNDGHRGQRSKMCSCSQILFRIFAFRSRQMSKKEHHEVGCYTSEESSDTVENDRYPALPTIGTPLAGNHDLSLSELRSYQ
jgi:hypothetical protein